MLIMKKFHLNLSVKDLDQSVVFYTALFGRAPTTLKSDYAKWMLEEPSLNLLFLTGLKLQA
jgi:predicted lactoylglutathione lyase